MSHPTRTLIQDALEAASWELNHWTSILPFNTSSLDSSGAFVDSEIPDLLEFVKPMYRGQKVYFAGKYKVESVCNGGSGSSFGKDATCWRQLLMDLELAGMKQGCHLVGNGGGQKRHIICRGSRMYQGAKKDQQSPSKQEYRRETLHADRMNSRGSTGKAMPRKTKTGRALHKDCICPFRFTIGVDDVGYYLIGGIGCAHHEHHPKVKQKDVAIPTRLIDVAEKDLIVSVASAKANDGVGRNIHFARRGFVLPRSQVRYIGGFRTRGEMAGIDNLDADLSTVDKLIVAFKENGYDHCVLYHHGVRGVLQLPTEQRERTLILDEHLPPTTIANGPHEQAGAHEEDSMIVNETYEVDVNDGTTAVAFSCPASTNVVLPDRDQVCDMQSFAKNHREQLGVEDTQDLMIGCAWTIPSEKRLFKMFSEVLHIDCTADTNQEDRPFLTITGRDSNGNMFTVIRAYLPNERAWVFRWLFQTVMPSLLGKDYISRVKVIVTDGDSQETSQLDIAIALHFHNVCRVRCGWHVVDRGWLRCGPGVRSVPRANEQAFKAITNQVKAWLYSWMRPCCETQDEYKISKALLTAYLSSPAFLDNANEAAAERIRSFIQENVEPLESFICFYPRRNVRHFDTSTNSGHEGTNNGLKTGAAPVLPQHSLDRSASILNHNAEIKAASQGISSATSLSTNVLWSKLPTSQKLTKKGEGLVIEQWQLRNNYISQRVSEKGWLVVGIVDHDRTNKAGLIPRFARVREVSILDNSVLTCSCMYFERVGIPCRHQMHVLCSVDIQYIGVTHHDVAVTWWKEFLKYGFSNEPAHQHIAGLYTKLLFDDIKGPSLPLTSVLPRIIQTIAEPFVLKPPKETCLNYDTSSITSALRQFHFTVSGADDDASIDDDNEGPWNTQQETTTYDINEGMAVTFPDHVFENPNNVSTPYSVIVPLAKELASLLEGNCSIEELQQYKEMLSDCIVKKKSEIRNQGGNQSAGKMVSCSVRSNKKQKTHGTKHMAYL
jgi:hypothetical protein